MKRILFLLALFVPALVYAQGEPVPAPSVDWLHFAVIAINMIAIPVLVQVLKPLWKSAPSLVKSLVPIVFGALLPLLETWLLGVFGEPLNLAALMEIWQGAAAGVAASVAFKMGAAK